MDLSDDIIPLFKNCTARVLAESEKGTGFFIAPDLLLTCTHVVKNDKSGTTSVMVQWEGQTYKAEIVCMLPEDYPDLALLKLESIPWNHPCVYLHNDVRIDDPLYTFGYSNIYPSGEPSSFNYEGIMGVPSPLMTFKFGNVRPGFSGGPILNRRTGGVCGITKLTREEKSLLGGRGVPLRVILENFPELIAEQKEFHQKDNRWFLRNLADHGCGILRGCAMFHRPRFLQTICLWSLPVLVLVLSVLTLFALMEHAQLEQIKFGSTIHTSFNEL